MFYYDPESNFSAKHTDTGINDEKNDCRALFTGRGAQCCRYGGEG
jgi:hypothetical protein